MVAMDQPKSEIHIAVLDNASGFDSRRYTRIIREESRSSPSLQSNK